MNLFKKAACFTDIHHGKKNNDRQHNQDCSDFVDFFLKQTKENDCDAIIFLGDWHDNRQTIHVSTLNYSLKNLEKLNNSGLPVYFIPGNHDLFYREKRDISSISMIENLKNIKLINEIYHHGNVTFFPWLVQNEWKQIQKYAKKSTYIFGHFEVPTFLMNAMNEMPDHHQLQVDHFKDVKEWAFTGHFHKRQAKDKVCYIGNTFPFDYSDTWDDDRGMMILEWEKPPVFIQWDQAPKYRAMTLSELLGDPEKYIDDLTSMRISQDIDLNYEETQLIKDVIAHNFNPRKFDLLSSSYDNDDEIDENVVFQSIDQIVTEGLKTIDSSTINKDILLEIYNDL